MTHGPVFICLCPHCDKRNQASIRLLVKKLNCVHCQLEFVAEDMHASSLAAEDPIYYWIRYTENAFGLGAEESEPNDRSENLGWKNGTELNQKPR